MSQDPKPGKERLSRREREIMNAVFSLENRASAEEVRGKLADPPGDSAVRVMLRRLEEKGFLKHRQDGLRFLCSATTSPAAAKRTALQQVLATFFGGSLKQMTSALVAEESWTDEDLAELRAQIDRARKGRKKSS